ncbi:hypothetical protein D3C72_2092180 [compost metagenome]
MDHGIGGGQVQAYATGLEADQEYLQPAILEVLHRRAAITGFAGQQGIGNATLLKLSLYQSQHAGELREQQHPTTFGKQFFEHLHQACELARMGAAGSGGFAVDQA